MGKGRNFGSETYTVDVYGGLKKCIDSGNVGLISCHINVDGANEGHMMSVQGYSTIRPKNSSTQIRSVTVADGWYNVQRYINLSQVQWILVQGFGLYEV